jgi:hypothetical protein
VDKPNATPFGNNKRGATRYSLEKPRVGFGRVRGGIFLVGVVAVVVVVLINSLDTVFLAGLCSAFGVKMSNAIVGQLQFNNQIRCKH